MSTPATPQSPQTGTNKADPDTLALRASPRPVTRLNRRMLAVLAGALGIVILGATLWSLQPHKRERNPATELYNVDRVSRADSLDQLPKDYTCLLYTSYARTNDPFARIGQTSTAVEITSVVRASESSFQVRWIERSYVNGSPSGVERWTAVLSIVLQPPRTEERLRKNPLGIYVNGLSWSRELDAIEGAKKP